jgi:hypothetical protein
MHGKIEIQKRKRVGRGKDMWSSVFNVLPSCNKVVVLRKL